MDSNSGNTSEDGRGADDRDEDEQMLFEVMDDNDDEHLDLHLHAGAMITARSAESAGGDLLDIHGRGGQSGGKFNIANDKFYSNKKSSQQQLKSHSKKRSAHGVKVLHSVPALKLQRMKAKLSKLKRLGNNMTHPAGLSSAMNQLQITPWNLSSNFVNCTNQDRGNIEKLEITGVGDPSGRGMGFSYVRTAPRAPVLNAIAKKKIPINRGGITKTGTDADLRRLSMKAAHEVLMKFNVPEDHIAKLPRWHRIAMIRKLLSEQAKG